MKTNLIRMQAFLMACLLLPFLAFSQAITVPRDPSPAASISQTIGISTITVKYSRPAVRGRQVWGNLVPYGWTKQGFGNNKEAPWRSGANENTTIEFSHAATVEGKSVPAGIYGLFFVINEDNTGEVILSKDYRSWGSFWYEAANDQLTAKIQIRDHEHTEALTFDFVDLSKNGTELVLNWEKKLFPIKIEFAVEEIVMANAIEELKGTTGFTWQGYSSAANYALQNNKNPKQALAWIDQAIAMNRNFTTLRIKSALLQAEGDTEQSKTLLKEAMAIATEGELNAYGYQLLGQGENGKAIEVFVANTERFPKSANTWDSLGEAYAVNGDSKNAVKNFKKALSLNPPANVRANSEKFLKQLGAL